VRFNPGNLQAALAQSGPDWHESQPRTVSLTPAAEKPWSAEPHRRLKLWIYNLPPSSDYSATGRTNKHFTLKENPLKRTDLNHFAASEFGIESVVLADSSRE